MNDINSSIKNLHDISFNMLKAKMLKEQGWLEEELEQLEKFYRNFLFLKKKYGLQMPIPPNKEIDEFWHNHILDTENYINDCNSIFGEYLHHYPYAGLDGGRVSKDELQSMFDNNTQALHYKEFGYYIYKIRPTVKDFLCESLIKLTKFFKFSLKKNKAES